MSRGQKLRIGIFILMMLIGSVLETLSISLVLSLVTAVMQPHFIETNKYAKMACELLDIHSANTFMINVIIELIVMYIGKKLFLYLGYYTQNRFVYNNRYALQQRLTQSYITRP